MKSIIKLPSELRISLQPLIPIGFNQLTPIFQSLQLRPRTFHQVAKAPHVRLCLRKCHLHGKNRFKLPGQNLNFIDVISCNIYGLLIVQVAVFCKVRKASLPIKTIWHGPIGNNPPVQISHHPLLFICQTKRFRPCRLCKNC